MPTTNTTNTRNTANTTKASKSGDVRRRSKASKEPSSAAKVKGAISAGKGEVFRRPQKGSNYIHWM